MMVRCGVVVYAGSATVPCVAMRRCVVRATRRHSLADRHLYTTHRAGQFPHKSSLSLVFKCCWFAIVLPWIYGVFSFPPVSVWRHVNTGVYSIGTTIVCAHRDCQSASQVIVLWNEQIRWDGATVYISKEHTIISRLSLHEAEEHWTVKSVTKARIWQRPSSSDSIQPFQVVLPEPLERCNYHFDTVVHWHGLKHTVIVNYRRCAKCLLIKYSKMWACLWYKRWY